MDKLEEYFDFLVGYGIATEEEITLVTSINGTNEEAFNSILYSRAGYRTLEQYKEMMEED
jgi:hypothetical protein